MLFDLDLKNPELNEDSVYSFGTYPVFEKLITAIPAMKIDTVLINIYTLVRNNHNKEITLGTTVSNVIRSMEELVQDLVIIFNTHNIFRPSIVFYYYDYRKAIPNDQLRPLDKSRTFCKNVFDMLRPRLIQKPKQQVLDGVTITLLMLQHVVPVYKALYNSLSNVKNHRKVLLFSHVALDYHLLEKDKKINIIESYTGRLTDNLRLSDKIFKNYEKVPFTRETHVLLGDKELIKPSLGIKLKRQLLALAIEEKWRLKTRMFIKDSVEKNNFTLPFRLNY